MTRPGVGGAVVSTAALRARQGPAARMGKDWVGVLEQVPLFRDLPRRHMRRVADLATVRRFEAGTSIIRAGEPGDAFYVILDGTAQVRPRAGRTVKLRAGDYFGEMALLDGAPRSAAVEATSEVLTMRVGRTGFAKLIKQEPQITAALLRTLAERVRRLEKATA